MSSDRDFDSSITPPISKSTKTYAAQRRPLSASTLSGIEVLFRDLTRLEGGDVEEYETISNAYNLQQLCDIESVTYDIETEKVEKIGKNYVYKVVGDIDGVSFEFDKEAKSFRKRPISCYSSKQRPDISVMYDGFVILLIEIDSGSGTQGFVNTMRKTILGLIDTIRWYRLHGTCSINEWTGFTFPKFNKKECVVKVTVTFNPYSFSFSYNYEKISTDRVRDHIIKTFGDNLREHRSYTDLDEVHPPDWYMKLSTTELDAFKDMFRLNSAKQLPSRQSLLIKGNGECYKFPIRHDDAQAMRMVSLLLPNPTSDFVIGLQPAQNRGYNHCFKYKYVHHGHLDSSEARLCLGDFVSKSVSAIEALHDCDVVHLDIRLDNICISDDYKPILIDLDRARHTDDWSVKCIYHGSVMYRSDRTFRGVQHDWLQLALIILWVLTEDIQPSSYHYQDFNVKHPVVENTFFKGLAEGKCVYSALAEFKEYFGGGLMLKDVIQQRLSAEGSHASTSSTDIEPTSSAFYSKKRGFGSSSSKQRGRASSSSKKRGRGSSSSKKRGRAMAKAKSMAMANAKQEHSSAPSSSGKRAYSSIGHFPPSSAKRHKK